MCSYGGDHHDWVWDDERDGYEYWICGQCSASERTRVDSDDEDDE